jgi:uncharacterized SAM-binding protein YcdF (DUF218 family)
MPVSTHPRRRFRLALGLSAVLLLVAGGFTFTDIGRFLAREDPLQKADAIFVFSGTLVERPFEAAELFREGYAPRVVVTRATIDQATFQLGKRGIRVPTEYDLNREVLLKVGVPAEVLVTPSFIHDNTGEEARTLRELALAHQWRRVILVSSKYHLRRLTLASRRALRGTNVEVIARGSRYDESVPDRWWTSRRDIRWVVSEVPKLVAYALGFGT